MRFEVETNLYNPSALAKKFSSIQTNFDVTLGKISAIISDSDIEQYQDGHTTMNSRLSSAIQDLDGFHQQVSKMQITYDGQFESVDNRLTTFDTTLNGITADVSSVSREAIKTDTIHYLATSASDGVTTSTYGWTTTPQSVTSTKRYLWIYHTYTKGDNSTTDSDPVIAGVWGNTGNKGDKGDSGVSISSVTNYYLATSASSGVTTSTSGWTTSVQTMTATKQYLWNYEVVKGSNGSTLNTTSPTIIGRYGQDGATGKGIKSITEYYQVSSSNSTAPTSWSTTPVATTTTNKYLWNYECITYTDDSTKDTAKRVIGTHGETGAKGDKGDSGVSISGVTNYYLATSSSSGVTKSTSGWTTNIQTMTATNQYLWNYERITGSDGSTLSESEPVIIGRYGQNGGNGRGISSITEYYAVSSSNTTAPTSWYTSLVNTTITNKYLWNYERIAYTDGTTANTTERVIGTHGETGDDGIGITATTPLRYASSSSTTPSKPTSKVTSTSTAVGVWTTAVPALSTTYPYMYTCDQIEWDDNTVTWTSVVRDNALTDLVSRVSAAELKITDSAIVSTVRSSTAYQNDLSSKNATYTGDYKPTASNAPASSWTTTALKESHINDTFLTSAGELYQYIYGCYGLMITFDDLSETETPSFDYVEIYYQIDGTTYVLPHLGGTAISGKNIFVPAPVFWLYWKSDSSVTKYGFKIKSIERGFNARPELVEGTLPSLTPTELSGTDFPETTHPYTNNEEKFWKYSTTYGSAATLTYGWSLRSDPNKTSASEVESIIEQKADSIRLKADKISWQSSYSSMTENGALTCTSGSIGGWQITDVKLYKNSSYTPGTSTTQYSAGMWSQSNVTSSSYAFAVQQRSYDGSSFDSWATTFYVTYGGKMYSNNAEIVGKITATSGYIGTSSSGFNITSDAIYNGISSLSATSGSGIYIGTGGINLGGGKFKVTSSGALTSKSGTIGGFTITSSSIYNGISTASASGTGVYLGTDGINLGGNFKVNTSGYLTSLSGSIGGWTINSSSISREVGRGTITLGGNGVTSTWGGYTVNFCGAGIWKGNYNYLLNFANSKTILSGDSGVRFVYGGNGESISLDYTSTGNCRLIPDYQNGSTTKFILGTSANNGVNRWYRLYCEVAPDVSSDLKLKNVIDDYDFDVDDFISGLKPIAFTRKKDDDKKVHFGFGAQDVFALTQKMNLGNIALWNASLINSDDETYYDGKTIVEDEKLSWSLSYEEFIAPMVLEIQRLMQRVEDLERRL